MRLLIYIVSSLFFFPAQAAELRITVEGIRSQNGTILIGLYDSLATFNRAIAMSDREGFLNDPSRFAAVALRANAALKSSVVFTNLNPGRYAIVLFHDEDGNGKLNKDALGVPTEPYGFSNDARGFLGPPAFEKAIMQIDDSDKVVRITLTRPGAGPIDDKSKRR
ncbi:DUF2141 domain-containing protein (plasmid) [Azospirillum baldaniorum]|uniref:DUF2141 domain-containing protein n=1 Tax=Azospirillum baldaniorum TaxID=1064539 RepID=A0A9P1NR70_9PROT|nr:DUF2141 domain-containing protein [Azospirillum baldaniorum]AWJ92863.1 DUF2141 domain-containing protein [Azospirillum baldaniorum]CCD02575.1 conserved exported protein of unknown function [Azospirillum baldaniorum]